MEDYNKVESTNIYAFRYKEDEELLYIIFQNTRQYKYFDIKKSEYDKLFNDEKFSSKNFREVVKGKKYEEIW